MDDERTRLLVFGAVCAVAGFVVGASSALVGVEHFLALHSFVSRFYVGGVM